jgi:hypothetical protein
MKLKTFRALALGTEVYHEGSEGMCTYIKVDDNTYRINCLGTLANRGAHGDLISSGNLMSDNGKVKKVHVVDPK